MALLGVAIDQLAAFNAAQDAADDAALDAALDAAFNAAFNAAKKLPTSSSWMMVGTSIGATRRPAMIGRGVRPFWPFGRFLLAAALFLGRRRRRRGRGRGRRDKNVGHLDFRQVGFGHHQGNHDERRDQ
ncbi:MAG: hypothetical protein MZU91_00995 [Desulfosudis oleivorans]|nr:hypothetical protein [Desulfosudis oleivorans]